VHAAIRSGDGVGAGAGGVLDGGKPQPGCLIWFARFCAEAEKEPPARGRDGGRASEGAGRVNARAGG
jgi:hypothetical protein